MQSIERQVRILDALSGAPETGLSITRVCSETRLPKATAHRLLESLQGYEIVVQEDTKRWRLGPRAAYWAGRYLEGPTSMAPLHQFVRELSQDTDFFTYLAVQDQKELVCVAVERPEHKAHFFVQLGSRVPILSTAAAKAILAFQQEDCVRSLVSQAVAANPNTRVETVTKESYMEELSEIRASGYAKCMEELEMGVSALGVPVLNARGESVASLSVVAPTAALVAAWDSSVKSLLRVSAEASGMLGQRQRHPAEEL